MRIRLWTILIMTCTPLVGCNWSGNGSSSPATNGQLTINITDAPVDDALEVVLVFTGIELQPESGGPTITVNFGTPKSIDILQFSNGNSTNLVDGAQVPAGRYLWMRLLLRAEQNLQSGSYIRLRDGRQFPLYIPSGSETGLKLVRNFNVAQGSITRLLIDFDLRKSVVAPPGQQPNWFLKPALRLIDELQVGTIKGTVDVAALATALDTTTTTCKPGIYAYTGSNVTPDDMDGSATDGLDPLVYFPITLSTDSTSAAYTIRWLEAGAYTLAATCQFDVDADPGVSEYDPAAVMRSMKFVGRNATVTNGSVSTVNLP